MIKKEETLVQNKEEIKETIEPKKENASTSGSGVPFLEEKVGYVPLPKKNEFEMFAFVLKLHGGDQLRAICDDGIERMCRITGKLKKKVWIREGDVIIIKVWDFQPSKADIVWRYLGPQKNWLQRRGHLKNLEPHMMQFV